MTKKPLFNAIGAIAYIILVVSVMSYVSDHAKEQPEFIMGVTMISLFTLSAAVMGYIFLLSPLQLYLDGKKKEGVNLFVKTVGYFAVLTVICFVIILGKFFN